MRKGITGERQHHHQPPYTHGHQGCPCFPGQGPEVIITKVSDSFYLLDSAAQSRSGYSNLAVVTVDSCPGHHSLAFLLLGTKVRPQLLSPKATLYFQISIFPAATCHRSVLLR